MNHESQFQKELNAFRNKYPMCYIEAWTPSDFQIDGNPMEWNDDAAIGAAEFLYENFDANNGTNWDSVAEAIAREKANWDSVAEAIAREKANQ